MEKHIIEIAKDGAVQITVQGVKGRSCIDATRDIEKALGKKTSDTLTGEAYEQHMRIQHSNKS